MGKKKKGKKNLNKDLPEKKDRKSKEKREIKKPRQSEEHDLICSEEKKSSKLSGIKTEWLNLPDIVELEKKETKDEKRDHSPLQEQSLKEAGHIPENKKSEIEAHLHESIQIVTIHPYIHTHIDYMHYIDYIETSTFIHIHTYT